MNKRNVLEFLGAISALIGSDNGTLPRNDGIGLNRKGTNTRKERNSISKAVQEMRVELADRKRARKNAMRANRIAFNVENV